MTNTNNTNNTNVINNAMDNEMNVMMIGEELLDVKQINDVTYEVYGSTLLSVNQYVHQIIGNCDYRISEANGVVTVTVVLDEPEIGDKTVKEWNELAFMLGCEDETYYYEQELDSYKERSVESFDADFQF